VASVGTPDVPPVAQAPVEQHKEALAGLFAVDAASGGGAKEPSSVRSSPPLAAGDPPAVDAASTRAHTPISSNNEGTLDTVFPSSICWSSCFINADDGDDAVDEVSFVEDLFTVYFLCLVSVLLIYPICVHVCQQGGNVQFYEDGHGVLPLKTHDIMFNLDTDEILCVLQEEDQLKVGCILCEQM
jgi:hypothetical protein